MVSLDCKTVRIFAYSSTREQSNKRSGTRLKTESEMGRDAKNTLGSFGFPPLRGAGTGFVVVLPLPLIFDPPLYILHLTIYTTFHREATLKTDRSITGLQHQHSKPSADNNTRYSPSKSITECIKFTKRNRFLQDFCEQIFAGADYLEPPSPI